MSRLAAPIDLSAVPPLSVGTHHNLRDGMCVMEAVAFIAGEAWSDHPTCACPVISAFLRTWNDELPDDERDTLLRQLIPLLVDSRGSRALEWRRAMMALDWLLRTYTPAWLRLAGLTTQADALLALPEITEIAECQSLMPTFNAVRRDAVAAGSAPWGDAGRFRCPTLMAVIVAIDAAIDAVRVPARDAWAAARDAWAAIKAADRAAAFAATRAAARDAKDALETTRLELQQSALRLVHRMLEATP